MTMSLKEIFNVTKYLKTPSMRMYLDSTHCETIKAAKMVQNEVEYIEVKDMCLSSEIYYDPQITGTEIAKDRNFVATYFEFPDEDVNFATLSPFLMRLTIDRAKLVGRNLNLEHIAVTIKTEFKRDVHIICSDENKMNMVIRIRAVKSEDESLDFYVTVLSSIPKLQLYGNKNVRKVYISEDNERKE